MHTLIAARCPGITLNSMHGFPELRHLDLTGCEGIAPATAVCPLPALPCPACPILHLSSTLSLTFANNSQDGHVVKQCYCALLHVMEGSQCVRIWCCG